MDNTRRSKCFLKVEKMWIKEIRFISSQIYVNLMFSLTSFLPFQWWIQGRSPPPPLISRSGSGTAFASGFSNSFHGCDRLRFFCKQNLGLFSCYVVQCDNTTCIPIFKAMFLTNFLWLWLILLLFRCCFALFIHLVYTLLEKGTLN